ncbi:cbb3-type cytochrome c oxidase subunit 3 [Alishewanella sp. 16-MA]|uniref:Cbb3-type cytochrome c oxidase subunit 3 n=1 Tax=Alishewanella maricola TaxID=2795740 RepID=A0ABS8C3I7_9ALTE|nr:MULTISPECIES: cbb3-type cytochrome c oxidase subunit 3 [Gammaproteobacteria]MDP4944980.1 cbb3-type cytochrome c oxidase subunit 3 [Alishewanella sp.]MCB5226893.1 cbb3-type cytochrome c oxidase subunit 3 [Alishewanella maricola]MCC5451960.1 cbb3-type cytochrome c oxidase subunit 3 [Rheinheimera sp. UJ51]MCF4009905.1 cbb3-type cytochrome c oxidase subunit 3 [Rheinheimera sp. UJ63]MDP5035415.1 cbb3-type cytochrome c oxidase subunit 3 [Alishewanella sp.]
MEFATVHSILTVILFVAFVAFVIWAYSKKRKSDFDEAANLVFDDEPESKKQHSKRESEHE